MSPSAAPAARMSSFMASTQRTKASRSSLGNSGSRTRCTVTPWRSSTAARRPPPRASTWTSTPIRDEPLGELAHVAGEPALDDRRVLPRQDQDAGRHGAESLLSASVQLRVRSSDGVHYAELNYPIGLPGGRGPVAALELHYDLKARDAALRADRTASSSTALAGAIIARRLISLLLGRLVVRPLDRIRAVANRIRGGESSARLGWNRSDEIGALARDIDALADDLLEALKDPLTGHLNHRAFQERLAQEMSRCRRDGTPLALVALDIDDFKIVNDTLGHAAGDDALLRLARAISRRISARTTSAAVSAATSS